MTSPGAITCPRCDGALETGFVVDFTYGAVTPTRWYAGKPIQSFLGNIKLRNVRSIEVATFRCTVCGHLESYAPDKK